MPATFPHYFFFRLTRSFTKLLLYIIPVITFCACTGNAPSSTTTSNFKKIPVTYPFSRKDTTVADQYFTQKINDPYRWLEDDQSAETKDWVEKQNIVTNG
ncbi:MAG: hypothetical protein LH618_14380, partial [Saprospiraceae bacterium]|nr:hypothetical protein [Saprospiraceae bacterium]